MSSLYDETIAISGTKNRAAEDQGVIVGEAQLNARQQRLRALLGEDAIPDKKDKKIVVRLVPNHDAETPHMKKKKAEARARRAQMGTGGDGISEALQAESKDESDGEEAEIDPDAPPPPPLPEGVKVYQTTTQLKYATTRQEELWREKDSSHNNFMQNRKKLARSEADDLPRDGSRHKYVQAQQYVVPSARLYTVKHDTKTTHKMRPGEE